MKNRPHAYYCKHYRRYVLFAVGTAPKELNRWLAKAKLETFSDEQFATTVGFACSLSDTTILVWTKSKTDYGALTHEALHAANIILEHAGVVADFKNDEPQAYLLTELVEAALKKDR